MDAGIDTDTGIAAIAAAIGDATRARMLVSLMDGRARTGIELAAVADVAPSTASAHLQRLQAAQLITVQRQGKHRYYSLGGAEIAGLLERLSALAGTRGEGISCRAPQHLRAARTCYDHLAGTIGVALLERFATLRWLSPEGSCEQADYGLTAAGMRAFTGLGVDVASARQTRRRFAFGCLDWTERRHHLGGALGAAFLQLAQRRKWVLQDLDSRALRLTGSGRRAFVRLGVSLQRDAGVP
jgi:DNA-binding transcriptional ArsR family regulator